MNTPGAELLYTKIAQWCNTSPETVVLDICCGTGTIGQTVAKVTLVVMNSYELTWSRASYV